MVASPRLTAADQARLQAIVAEYRRRRDAGDAVDPLDVIAGHPDLAGPLTFYFQNAALVDSLGGLAVTGAVGTVPTPTADATLAGTIAHSTATDPAMTDAGPSPAPDAPPPAAEVLPHPFGRYRLLRRLGRGGWGRSTWPTTPSSTGTWP